MFSVPATALTGTTGYTFSVPPSSSVIVNVTGASPTISNAGFNSAVPAASQLLWNFPDATTLTLKSVGFIGSILAPKALANLQNGSVQGTVVVAQAAPALVELYSATFHVPSCQGALCVDSSWSSTASINDDGTAADFANEAGFLEITGGPHVAEGQNRVSPTNRIWYTFQPSQLQPKTKPLAVFFNGGPGAATSSLLFAFNTAHWTVDPDVVGTSKILPNSLADWGQVANLLYIDAPAAGFSYPIANDDGTRFDIGNDLDRDAGVFDRVVLRFLKRHPEILNNRVVIVGESYGGVRATLMLQYLFNYSSVVSTGPYTDVQLNNDELDYFNAVFGTPTPSPSQIQSKFGHQVLLEPVIVGNDQKTATPGDPMFPFPVCSSPHCASMIPGG